MDERTHPNVRLDDEAAHAEAETFLAEVLHLRHAPRVCWDPAHCLQGHLEHQGDHLVVIAPRDRDHRPLLLSESQWDEFHRSQGTRHARVA